MVKLILAFILLANVFKVIESGRYFEDQDILFAMEENKKGYCFDVKEKQEQDIKLDSHFIMIIWDYEIRL